MSLQSTSLKSQQDFTKEIEAIRRLVTTSGTPPKGEQLAPGMGGTRTTSRTKSRTVDLANIPSRPPITQVSPPSLTFANQNILSLTEDERKSDLEFLKSKLPEKKLKEILDLK